MPTPDDLEALAIKVGVVRRAEPNLRSRNPSLALWIDFGDGEKQSSAQITDRYEPDDLVGRQVVAVTGFDPIRIGGFRSDVLVLGAMTNTGVVLLRPDIDVPPGTAIA